VADYRGCGGGGGNGDGAVRRWGRRLGCGWPAGGVREGGLSEPDAEEEGGNMSDSDADDEGSRCGRALPRRRDGSCLRVILRKTHIPVSDMGNNF
jgi:hypothetical protein